MKILDSIKQSSLYRKLFVGKSKKSRPRVGTFVLLILQSFYILIPFWIIFVTALKTIQEAAMFDFTWWPTLGITWDAFKRVWEYGSLQKGFLNTLMFYIPPTVIGLVVSTIAAYGFAKMEWKGRDTVFSFLMLTMMIPGSVTMTATRLIYDYINWIGTPYPVMIPGMFGGISIVFFLRQYIKGIPDDLIGAAKIDGAGELYIVTQLVMPIAAPAMLAQGVLTFIGHYNDYLGALLYLIDEPLFTLQIAIKNLGDTFRTDLPSQMAAAFIGMAPILIIYALLQNYIIKGISISSGLKG